MVQPVLLNGVYAMVRMILATSLIGWFWHAPAVAHGCDAIPVTQRLVSIPPAPAAASVNIPASALFTSASAAMREARSADARTTWLLGPHNQSLLPLADIEKAARKGAYQVRWYRPVEGAEAATVRLSLDTMEHVYALLLKQNPQHHFEFPAGKKTKAKTTWLSHSQALARVASMRSCLATELQALQPDITIKPWQVATIDPQPLRGAHGLEVAAEVRDARGQPIAGHLSFSRGSHLGCGATVQKNGAGQCTLFDEHGHELHDHEHHARTVVMFSGSVAADRIILPTTQVYGEGVRR
jgi:hypothetical protein